MLSEFIFSFLRAFPSSLILSSLIEFVLNFGMKIDKNVTSDYVPPETSFKKNWIYILLNFFVSFRNFIPVQPGFVVVNCVITVIEKKKIQKPGIVP